MPVFAATGTQTSTPTVHGMVQETVEKVPELDAKNFGGTKFDVSKVPLVLMNPQYFVSHGQPSQKGSQHGYDFQYLVKVKQGQAGVIELAYTIHRPILNFEVGVPTSASVAAMQA
ncbi:hypothetical protein JZ785_03815 [Alicyclobacillus curvatus]|nr:hypothetical protein JZ785_03815 [Alicyclobacillus curvatus]